MNTRPCNSRLGILALGVVLAVGAGCADRSYDRYIPTEDKARQALETTLIAWRDGKQAGAVEGGPAAIQAVDSRWLAGHKLASYEILGEEPPSEGPRVFTVKLTMKKPAVKPLTVRYYVVGKEPLWVYREDDYKAPAGM